MAVFTFLLSRGSGRWPGAPGWTSTAEICGVQPLPLVLPKLLYWRHPSPRGLFVTEERQVRGPGSLEGSGQSNGNFSVMAPTQKRCPQTPSSGKSHHPALSLCSESCLKERRGPSKRRRAAGPDLRLCGRGRISGPLCRSGAPCSIKAGAGWRGPFVIWLILILLPLSKQSHRNRALH